MWSFVMIRRLLSLLMAIGLAASPLTIAEARAHEAASHNQALAASHCPDADKAPAKHKQASHACCTAMASALLPAPIGFGPEPLFITQPAITWADQLVSGRAPKQDPPPPRATPEI